MPLQRDEMRSSGYTTPTNIGSPTRSVGSRDATNVADLQHKLGQLSLADTSIAHPQASTVHPHAPSASRSPPTVPLVQPVPTSLPLSAPQSMMSQPIPMTKPVPMASSLPVSQQASTIPMAPQQLNAAQLQQVSPAMWAQMWQQWQLQQPQYLMAGYQPGQVCKFNMLL